MEARIQKIGELAKRPLQSDKKLKRVEIIILKYKEEPRVIMECIERIVTGTEWPFKLNIFDNRPNNANTSRAWNKLIKESTCDYICFIDSDAFVPITNPCWLTRMMESIDETGIVVPMGDNVGGANKALSPQKYPAASVQKSVWSGFCFLLKKSVLKETGLFDQEFYIYGQDSEFAHRAARKIGGAVYRLDVLVKHLGSYSFKKASARGEVDREADKIYAANLYRSKTSL